MTVSLKAQALMAAALLTMPTMATAQGDAAAQANEVAQQIEDQANSLDNIAAEGSEQAAAADADRTDRADNDRGDNDRGDNDDDDFPWGLLGLLGLAGLLGLKRRDDHIHHDHRTTDGTTRTGTRTGTDTDTRL